MFPRLRQDPVGLQEVGSLLHSCLPHIASPRTIQSILPLVVLWLDLHTATLINYRAHRLPELVSLLLHLIFGVPFPIEAYSRSRLLSSYRVPSSPTVRNIGIVLLSFGAESES